jgi:hypothetical protein
MTPISALLSSSIAFCIVFANVTYTTHTFIARTAVSFALMVMMLLDSTDNAGVSFSNQLSDICTNPCVKKHRNALCIVIMPFVKRVVYDITLLSEWTRVLLYKTPINIVHIIR